MPTFLRVPVLAYVLTLSATAWRAIARIGYPGENKAAQTRIAGTNALDWSACCCIYNSIVRTCHVIDVGRGCFYLVELLS